MQINETNGGFLTFYRYKGFAWYKDGRIVEIYSAAWESASAFSAVHSIPRTWVI